MGDSVAERIEHSRYLTNDKIVSKQRWYSPILYLNFVIIYYIIVKAKFYWEFIVILLLGPYIKTDVFKRHSAKRRNTK